MRSFLALALSAGACLGACTNDYDGLLEGASGGGSPTSTADASSSTAEASSNGSSASGSTTTGSSSSTSSNSTSDASSSSSSGGGDGGAGGSGGGGDGGKGGGGVGGELPGSEPCDIAIDLEDDDLPTGWDIAQDGCTTSIENGTLVVESDSDDFSSASLYYRFVDDEFQDCSITTSVIDFEGGEDDTPLRAYLGLFAPDNLYLARIRINDGQPWTNEVVLRDGPDSFSATEPADEVTDPPSRIRIRAHGDDVSFDVIGDEDGDTWKPIHTMSRAQVGPEISGVSIGASRRSEDDDFHETQVVLGPVNPD